MSSRIRIESLQVVPSAEGDPAGELLPVLVEWRRIAARAWEGYLVAGPGTVTVDVDEGASLGYRLGAPCECHQCWIDEYDPEAEVILRILCGESEWIYRLAGWPSPPAAFACVTADDLEASVH